MHVSYFAESNYSTYGVTVGGVASTVGRTGYSVALGVHGAGLSSVLEGRVAGFPAAIVAGISGSCGEGRLTQLRKDFPDSCVGSVVGGLRGRWAVAIGRLVRALGAYSRGSRMGIRR